MTYTVAFMCHTVMYYWENCQFVVVFAIYMCDNNYIKLCTYNVNGLGNYKKRKDVFDYLRTENASVFFFFYRKLTLRPRQKIWYGPCGVMIVFWMGITQIQMVLLFCSKIILISDCIQLFEMMKANTIFLILKCWENGWHW